MRHTLGTSLLAIRSVSAVAGAALVVLTGLLARELGGGRFAMGLSALASGLAFAYVVKHYLFTMNALEPLFWTGCAFLVVRIVKMGDQRLRLGFGLLAGLGLQKKYSTAVYGLGLVVGLVLSPEREAFRKPWIWLGGRSPPSSSCPTWSGTSGHQVLNGNRRASPCGWLASAGCSSRGGDARSARWGRPCS